MLSSSWIGKTPAVFSLGICRSSGFSDTSHFWGKQCSYSGDAFYFFCKFFIKDSTIHVYCDRQNELFCYILGLLFSAYQCLPKHRSVWCCLSMSHFCLSQEPVNDLISCAVLGKKYFGSVFFFPTCSEALPNVLVSCFSSLKKFQLSSKRLL